MGKRDNGSLDAASGNIWVRAVKLLLERLGRKAGERLGATEAAQSLLGKVEQVVGQNDLNKLLEGAALVVPIFLQDTLFARLIQRAFRLHPDLARELSNEGFDSLLESFFDKVKNARGAGDKQDRALMSAAREFESEAETLLKAKHPELFEEVLHLLATNRAHKTACSLVREDRGAIKRTLYEVRQLGGEMTQECSCVGATVDPAGSFQQAYRRLGPIEKDRVDALLITEFNDLRKQALTHTGETRKVSPEDLRTVLETDDQELRKERFIALLGLTIQKSEPKSPIARVTDYAVKGLEVLTDSEKRGSFNNEARVGAAGQRTINRALSRILGK